MGSRILLLQSMAVRSGLGSESFELSSWRRFAQEGALCYAWL